MNPMYIISGLMIAGQLLTAPLSQANAKPIGNPVPYLCSAPIVSPIPNTPIVAVRDVCYGRLEGSNQAVLIVGLNDRTQQIWKIRGKYLLPSRSPTGDSYSSYSLDLTFIGEVRAGGFTTIQNDNRVAYLRERVAADSQILSVHGTLPGNLRFEARTFEEVAVTP